MKKKESELNNKNKVSAVIMASGNGKRFGSNKLLTKLNGIPIIEYLFKSIPTEIFERICVVSKYEEILNISEKYNFYPVYNSDTTDDIAVTIRKGIEKIPDDSTGCMFFTGDQPLLKKDTIVSLLEKFLYNSSKICVLKSKDHRGNPVIFPRNVFNELMNLPKNHQGKMVIKAHEDIVIEHEINDPDELMDVDFEYDLKIISEKFNLFSQ